MVTISQLPQWLSDSDFLIQNVNPTDDKPTPEGRCGLKSELTVRNRHLCWKQKLKDTREKIMTLHKENIFFLCKDRLSKLWLIRIFFRMQMKPLFGYLLGTLPMLTYFILSNVNHKMGLAAFQKCFSTVQNLFLETGISWPQIWVCKSRHSVMQYLFKWNSSNIFWKRGDIQWCHSVGQRQVHKGVHLFF